MTQTQKKELLNRIDARLEANGQSNALPLFNVDEPVEETIEPNLTGSIKKGSFGNSFVFEYEGRGIIILGTDIEPKEEATMHMADFVAQRDYTSKQGNKYEKGVTTRFFAYRA